jgi:V-type H+-transporting ATPase subunit D
MSGSTNRYQVPPTVTVLTMMKGRLIGATKGHALLKKKADALTVRYRQILKEIVEAKQVGLGVRRGGGFACSGRPARCGRCGGARRGEVLVW